MLFTSDRLLVTIQKLSRNVITVCRYIMVAGCFCLFQHTLYAQINVVLVRVVGKASCGYNTDLCYSVERGSAPISEMLQLARSRVPCNAAILLNDVRAGVKNYVVVESVFTYPDTDCKGLVYALGAGNSREEAKQEAIKNLASNNWSWRDAYPVRVVREEAVTPGGGYDKSITSYGSEGTRVSTTIKTNQTKTTAITPSDKNKSKSKNPLGDPPTVRQNTSLPYEGFDPYTKELYHKLQLAVDGKNTADIYHLVEELKEVYLQGYPDLAGQLSNDLDVLLGEFERQNNADYGSHSDLHEDPQGNITVNQNPQGWQLLTEYQQLLNQFIDAINSQNVDELSRIAEALQKWVMAHETDLERFDIAQNRAFAQCSDYFAEIVTNGLTSGSSYLKHVDFISKNKL